MKEVLDFLAALETNNNRDWFLANKKKYESAKSTVAKTVDLLIQNISKFDPSVSELLAKNCMFRINRDVRFSANKNPYKNNMGAWIAKGGKKSYYAGYYLHIQPENSFLAAGVFMPEPPQLNAIRQEIYFNHAAFTKVLQEKSFHQHFPQLDDYQLKTAPKGFDKEHEAIHLLKYKSYVVSKKLTDKEVCSADFMKLIVEQFKRSFPLVKFLNEALEMKEE